MITGRQPFQGQTPTEIILHIAHDKPERIRKWNEKAPAELERIIQKCLEKDRERRYYAAEELLLDVKKLKEGGAWAMTARARHLALAGFAAVLLALALLWGAGARLSSLVGGRSPRIQSLAILPLANLSGDASQDFFADAMTEALSTELGQIK